MNELLRRRLAAVFGEDYETSVPDACKGLVADLDRELAKLSEERAIFQMTLESTDDGILVVDEIGKILFYNRRFLELWRIPKELADAGDDARLLDFVLDKLVDGKKFMVRVRELYASDAEDKDVLRFKDGRVFERYSRSTRVDGARRARVWSFRDISDRLKDEEAVRAKAEELERMNRLMIGREVKMSELKEEIAKLKGEVK